MNNKTIGGMKCILFLFGLLALPAQAASFDCAKATTKIEKLVCENEELSKLDEDLNKAYLTSLERSDVKQQAIKSQRAWLKNRRNICQNSECLKSTYETRIKEIQGAKVPKNETEQSWEWVEDDTRSDEVLKTVAQKEFLIGTWEEVDGVSVYGTMKIENNSISWGRCKTLYSIALNTVGDTYPDKLKFEDTQGERYVTLKLKLESGTCDKNLGYLQFSIAPNNPELAKVIEYGKDNKPVGWMNFSKH